MGKAIQTGIKRAMIPPARMGDFRGLLAAGLILCAGCSSIHTKTPEGEPVVMNEADFAAYFEHVFRHHNNVVNELLYVSTGNLDGGNDPMSAAEMKMDHACQPLNEIAAAAAGGQPADFWTKMQLMDAVPECEAATRRLEKLLPAPDK